jgi:tRNA-2-methylthio-N6-dimethylallyladenosine synthase
MTAPAKIFLDSYGCQMNLYDGELVSRILQSRGFEITGNESEADVILINTCSVREHAEQRAIGRMRSFSALKKRRPDLVLGVLGCMARRLREELKERIPDLNLIVGPDAYRELPDLLCEQLNGGHGVFHYLSGDPSEIYEDVLPDRREGVNAWVAIMRGCDNFCSYCIVPFVRGRERSRSPDDILSEVRGAVEEGFPEVTLLGQNVNSYRWENLDFPDLLEETAKVPGLRRLRFLTSHPKDLSDKLIDRLAEGGVICPSLHLPAQSGSNRILEAMNRGYTREEYLKKVAELRRRVPNLALSTDLLCGFPGETEEDFNQTIELMREARFDDAFTFKYSVRPGTAAAKLDDDVPEEVKIERLERLISEARRLSDRSRRALIGREVEVLLEDPSPKNSAEWSGKTACGRMALVPGKFHRGDQVRILVEEIRGFSLWGKPVQR